MAERNKQKEPTQKPYKVSLVFGDKIFSVEADSVKEGLTLLKPDMIKGLGKLRVEKDGLKSELRIVPMKIRKLLVDSFWQNIFDRRMNYLLK